MQKKIDDYKENFTSPFVAASRGYLDDIIPNPYDPFKDLSAFLTAVIKSSEDCIAKSISWAITSVSVSDLKL